MDGRRHAVATAREADLDRQTALDLGLDKVDRQVIKLKEKIKERKRPAQPAPAPGLKGDPRDVISAAITVNRAAGPGPVIAIPQRNAIECWSCRIKQL